MDPTTIEAIVQGLVGLATVFITVILAPLILKQGKVADGKLSDKARQTLYPILVNAISWGQAKLTGDTTAESQSAAAIQDHIITQAIAYTRLHAGDTLDQLGVTDEALRRMLQARLQQAIAFARTHIPGISDAKAALVGMPSTPPAA